jgi:uncharacterized membrane protein
MLPVDTSVRIRRAAILGAVASWASIAFFAVAFLTILLLQPRGGVILPVRRLLLVGVLGCCVLWALALLDAWPVRCDRCRRQLLISFRLSGSAQRTAIYDQLLPGRFLKTGQITCPNCGYVAILANSTRRAS